MELRRLEYFMILARHLHFGRAAAEIGIAQPGLSQQIKVLERELQVTLLERDRRGVSLTDAGEILQAEAGPLLEWCASVRGRVRGAAGDGGGLLRVVYTRSAADLNAGALVRGFARTHPTITIESHTAWTAWNLELLQERKVEVAFVRGPVEQDGIRTLTVDEEELVVALPDGHPLAGFGEVERSALRDEPVVLWHRPLGQAFYDSLVAQVWPDGGPRIVHQEPEAEQILAAVAEGIGISVLDRRRADKLLPGTGVTLRPFTGPPPTVSVALAWRTDERSAAAQAFAGWCRERCTSRDPSPRDSETVT